MRIDKLTIGNFKNLQDFTIDFDEKSLATVLVGQNGAGKSNLLEALVLIFRDLDLGAMPAFRYQISYLCRGHEIRIDADPERSKEAIKVSLDHEPISYSKFVNAANRQYLPNYVFGYYSGPSNRLESHFEEHQQRFYKALLEGDDRVLRPMFYARLVHSQFVLLSFFTSHDPEALQFLKEYLGIEAIDSVLFVLSQPPWKSREGDPRFWNARGIVQQFLDHLYGLALAPIRIMQRVPAARGKFSTLEHLYLYIPDIQALGELAQAYSTQQEFFKTLESTYISQLIREVRIRVKVRNIEGALTFRELSEGEQQLLTVLGLLRFTKEQESLFLLDEPDTHLNPTWSQQYLNLIRQVVGENDTSQVLIASHDPLVLAGLQRSQVQIMKRDAGSGRVTARMPDEDPKGMGIAGILTSDLFDFRAALDPETLGKLDRKRELATKEELTNAERTELEQLNESLGNIDFTHSVRDPLYKQFVEALVALDEYRQLRKPVLSHDERERQKQLAEQVLQGIKDRQSE